MPLGLLRAGPVAENRGVWNLFVQYTQEAVIMNIVEARYGLKVEGGKQINNEN